MPERRSLFAIAAICAALAGCGEKPAPAAAHEPRWVKALTIAVQNLDDEAAYGGEVRARHEATLSFRVGGKLVERRVEVGSRVRKGDVLARLDPSDLALAVRQAEANHALAAAEARRARELRQKNFISQAALEAKETALAAAEAQRNLAHNQLAYAELRADTEGVVAAVLVEAGQVIAAGQPVLRLARDGEREVAVALPESRVISLASGAPAEVRLWDGRRYRGVLRELAPMAEPMSRTFAARVSILEADASLRLGMSAQVIFRHEETAAITVPFAALTQKGDQPAVWVIGADQTVSLRPIEVARYGDRGVVVKQGLRDGETIVAAGAFLLSEGEKVRIAR